ncbi:MAG: DUF4855 domain-containing protein [Clostridia bacterium]|nr:DUF4855 domain-containing protein [Clostridia bacterium]
MHKRIAFVLALLLLISPFAVAASAEEDEINLASGLEYIIETGEPVEYSYSNFIENGVEFDVDEGQLTDGKTALVSESSSGWYRAFRAKSRMITFDLGDVCAVSRIEASFLHLKNSGIYAPRYINVYLSDDGTEYGVAAEHETEFPLHSTEPARYEAVVELKKTYSARYVRVEFCCDIFAFCDEIEIYGSRELSGSEAKVRPQAKTEPAGYLKSLAGVTDIIKIYNGYYSPSPEIGIISEEDLLPYIAYINTSGEIAGLMFDSVAFVPCHGDYPSGGRLVKTNGKPGAIMSDWELYFEHTFKEGQDLDALDNVVGRVYGELGINKKFKVFLTLPYPTVMDKAFGDIDSDGLDEYCKTLDERVAIVKWFADKCISRFKENKYENIELAGFYWLREEVNYSDSDHEAELVKQINKYIDKKKLVSLFDPFYLSVGYDHWEELGFSGAVMQPNVAFDVSSYFELSMLGEFAVTASENYLGVEIETDEPYAFRGDDYAEAGRNYESYLYYGYKTGYMNSLKTYYQGAGPGSIYDFCYSDISTPKGIYLRRLYDLTYSFINGTYKNLAPEVSVSDIEMVSGDKRSMVDIVITDPDSYWENVSIEFPTMPQHGRVASAAGKKTLIYSPDENFVGEDSFTVIVSDGFNYSEEITVKVTVSEPQSSVGAESSQPNGNENSGDNQQTDKGTPVWLIILISVLGAAIVAVAAAMIIKQAKKAK